ncbi:hypothetical protein TCAL_03389 [Tigriopus californicus]|uniref:Btz domain-containing protein n=1 Tax=Tigriopus californicus TaxID=6832 RepID=A0A553P3L4_TIGCA|nr:bcl-2-associated transcription factor 1-like [Tigriopus californicus]TRY72269.1 hypothetical protein TCAL_03389 [Tigriopus californicus]
MPEHRRRHRSRSPGSSAASRLESRARRPHSPPRMRSDDAPRPQTGPGHPVPRPVAVWPAAIHRRPALPANVSPQVQIRRHVSPGLLKRRTQYQTMFRRDLESLERGQYRALGSKTRAEHGLIFGSSEFGPVEAKEQRKIQIDIRRNIPSHRISTSPVRRKLTRPESLRIPRRPDEGGKPIFDRPEFLECLESGAIQEERTVNMVAPSAATQWPRGRDLDASDTRPGLRNRSRSPLRQPDLRRRLGDTNPRESIRDRLGSSSHPTHMDQTRSERSRVRDRLGGSSFRHRSRGRGLDEDDDPAILDREELERQRPMVKPWDVNPEFVPRGRNYFEHDDREGGGGHQNETSRFDSRGFGDGDRRRSSRGGFGGRGRRGGGEGRGDWSRGGGDRNFSRRKNRGGSPDWKHDKFAEINQDDDDSHLGMDEG